MSHDPSHSQAEVKLYTELDPQNWHSEAYWGPKLPRLQNYMHVLGCSPAVGKMGRNVQNPQNC